MIKADDKCKITTNLNLLSLRDTERFSKIKRVYPYIGGLCVLSANNSFPVFGDLMK